MRRKYRVSDEVSVMAGNLCSESTGAREVKGQGWCPRGRRAVSAGGGGEKSRMC